MSVPLAAPPAAWADPDRHTVGSRVWAMCVVELQKLRHDRSELVTRAIQPCRWLVIFGVTFSRLRAIPTGGVPHLDYLAPGVLAQSALFMSIFYGIQVIWERDAGVLAPRRPCHGKAFAAGVRALTQAIAAVST